MDSAFSKLLMLNDPYLRNPHFFFLKVGVLGKGSKKLGAFFLWKKSWEGFELKE